MEIRELSYFTEVVKNNFNITDASYKLHISQPALSQYIKNLEYNEGMDFFIRSKGRLVGLTEAGEILYANAISLINEHDRLVKEIRHQFLSYRGTIRIGIPPLIVTVLFTKFLVSLITNNPEIKFNIVEIGAFDLEKQLLMQEVDFAILLKPTNLIKNHFKEEVIFRDTLTAFVSKNNPLAKQGIISWHDLRKKRLAIFDETYTIHHEVKQKLQKLGIEANFFITAKSWDFLLESVKSSDLITILPSPIKNHFNSTDVVELEFDQPIPWEVIFVYPRKKHYSRIELFVKKSIIEYFAK